MPKIKFGVEMNWEIAGALGEIIGGCAVIVTIGFLAIQMRQANSLGRAEAEREWFSIQQQLIREMYGTEDRVQLMRAGMTRYSELTPDQQGVFTCHLVNYFDHVDVLRRLHEKGYVADDLLNRLVDNLNAIVSTPGGAIWWEQNSPILSIRSYFELHRQEDATPITTLLPWAGDTQLSNVTKH